MRTTPCLSIIGVGVESFSHAAWGQRRSQAFLNPDRPAIRLPGARSGQYGCAPLALSALRISLTGDARAALAARSRVSAAPHHIPMPAPGLAMQATSGSSRRWRSPSRPPSGATSTWTASRSSSGSSRRAARRSARSPSPPSPKTPSRSRGSKAL